MKICDINPFIRYANMSELRPIDAFVYAYDCRLFYVAEGECEITIEETDYRIPKDTLLLWRAGTKYRFKKYDNIQIIMLNFDYTQKNNEQANAIPLARRSEFDRNRVLEFEDFENCDSLNQPLAVENMQGIKKQLIDIVEKFNSVGLYRNEICSSILKEVLTKVAAMLSYSETKTLSVIDTVLAYIRGNFSKEITNQDIGSLMGYHPYYINRLMLKYTGTTLRQHLINVRLDAAKEMLTQTELPICEISERCGFKNPAYFSNHFKLKQGMAPNEYRNKYRHLI